MRLQDHTKEYKKVMKITAAELREGCKKRMRYICSGFSGGGSAGNRIGRRSDEPPTGVHFKYVEKGQTVYRR